MLKAVSGNDNDFGVKITKLRLRFLAQIIKCYLLCNVNTPKPHTLVSETTVIMSKKINAESVSGSLSNCAFEVTLKSCFLLSLVF